MHSGRLFRASCIALVATAMSFGIRGDIMGDFETVFSLTATEVGWIAGAAFWGFGLSILFGGPLCDVLGMRTLAEGVEYAEQREILRREGCEYIQGFLLSRPVPASDVAALINCRDVGGLIRAVG